MTIASRFSPNSSSENRFTNFDAFTPKVPIFKKKKKKEPILCNTLYALHIVQHGLRVEVGHKSCGSQEAWR